MQPPPPLSGPFEVFDVFKNQSLGIRHGEGFWAEVDESSMLLVRISCKVARTPTHHVIAETDDESSLAVHLDIDHNLKGEATLAAAAAPPPPAAAAAAV